MELVAGASDAAVRHELRLQLASTRIKCRGVHVRNTVVQADRVANEVVRCPALSVGDWSTPIKKHGRVETCDDRGADHFDARGVHAAYSILQASDDRACRIVLSSKVINAFEPDHRCQAGEAEYITIQSIHCCGTDKRWIDDCVTDDAFVHD